MQIAEENEVLCIIPARNEAESLPKALEGLLNTSGLTNKNFILVNNASSDETKSIAESFGILVLDCDSVGYGSACLVALKFIETLSLKPKYLLFCDADGSDDPRDIPKLIHAIKEANADLVMGSRILGNPDHGSLAKVQIFGNFLTNLLIRIFFKKSFTDMGPLRIVLYSSLVGYQMKDTTWGWNIEMHVKALQKSHKVFEIPVAYRKRIAGKSKISGTLPMALRVGCKILYTFFSLSLFRGK